MDDVVGTLLVRGERHQILSDFMLIGQKDDESKADVQIVDERLVRYHVALRRFPEQQMWIIKDLCPERSVLLIAGRNVGGQPIIFRARLAFSVADVEFVFEPAKHTVAMPRKPKSPKKTAEQQQHAVDDSNDEATVPVKRRARAPPKKKAGKTWNTVTLSPQVGDEDDGVLEIEVLTSNKTKRARS